MAPTQLFHLHMDPKQPVPGVGDGLFLDDLPVEAIDAIVKTAVKPLVSLEIRHLGGALATPYASHGASGSLDAGYAMFTVGVAITPELGAAVSKAVDQAKAALAPWESTRTCFNFSDRPIDALNDLQSATAPWHAHVSATDYQVAGLAPSAGGARPTREYRRTVLSVACAVVSARSRRQRCERGRRRADMR